MPDRRPFLSSWDADWNAEWTAQVDALDAYALGPRRSLRTLVAQAPRYRAAILRGSVSAKELYFDLLAAAAIGRRGVPSLLVDATWEPGSRMFRRLDPDREATTHPVDLVPQRGAAAIRAAVDLLDSPRTHYGVLSTEELRSFPGTWGVPPERVHRVLFCATLPATTPPAPEGRTPAVFAGGDSLRDYRALREAAPALHAPLTIATRLPIAPASDPRHRFGPLDPAAYDEAAAAATVAVVPLLAGSGRSAGQRTYLNAMLLGQATVITDAPGVRDHVTDGEDALVVPNEPRALAEAVNRLLDDPELARRIGRAGRRTVMERFLAEDFYRGMLEAARSIAGPPAEVHRP